MKKFGNATCDKGTKGLNFLTLDSRPCLSVYIDGTIFLMGFLFFFHFCHFFHLDLIRWVRCSRQIKNKVP